jgi:hypothetical protein
MSRVYSVWAHLEEAVALCLALVQVPALVGLGEEWIQRIEEWIQRIEEWIQRIEEWVQRIYNVGRVNSSADHGQTQELSTGSR